MLDFNNSFTYFSIFKNHYEQEVRVEKSVQVAKAQKRADYTFYQIKGIGS